ncbi:MAG TPA: 3'-5' exonuclease [Polyangiales bacterium]
MSEPASEALRAAAESEQTRIVSEEEKTLSRVQKHLETREVRRPSAPLIDYDKELLILRDAINEARLEDIPPLLEEMERLQGVAARRAEVIESHIDPKSPYFGRLLLLEGEQKREILIGRGTYLDSRTGVRIVDWRDAPVSRLYYRYDEGDDYDEEFGGREVTGEVLTRRSLAISEGALRRIGCPQGIFVKTHDGRWLRADDSARLHGGQGAAPRPEHHRAPSGRLGVGGDGERRTDKFLPEIAAMIDPRQFELITRPSSGLVVIQGGAGSGKTTIGLHRLAYLAYQEPKRFRKDRMLVVVFNKALARYISRVLPALGVEGVQVVIYQEWVTKLRRDHFPLLPKEAADETPAAAAKLKKSPAMLRMIEDRLEELSQEVLKTMLGAAQGDNATQGLIERTWKEGGKLALDLRLDALSRWATQEKTMQQPVRRAIQTAVSRYGRKLGDVITVWSELLTDAKRVRAALAKYAPDELSEGEIEQALSWCDKRCPQVVAEVDEQLDEGKRREDDDGGVEEKREARRDLADDLDDLPTEVASGLRPNKDSDDDDLGGDDDEIVISDQPTPIDHEDESLLLLLHKRLRGPLMTPKQREVLEYEHILVDEAQDLSPVELSVVLATTSNARSVTLAGDVAQRLHMDNGFRSWTDVLGQLGLSHVEIEPLKLSYRSTYEIIEFAHQALGPLAPEEMGKTTRSGAPVELFRFAHSGDAVGFLAESLRDLARAEPRASIAVIARYPEQADLYYQGLVNAEVPNVRRVADQDFPFKPGVDVTDVKQVKGLEFDYVVLTEVNTATYPENDEARHLMHIAATRAAHQLWLTCTATPSSLVPALLRERGY